MQWRGGSGFSSVATVILTSVPHKLHRYWSFTFRSSPAGGGSGIGVASARSIAMPVRSSITATATATMIFSTGILSVNFYLISNCN